MRSCILCFFTLLPEKDRLCASCHLRCVFHVTQLISLLLSRSQRREENPSMHGLVRYVLSCGFNLLGRCVLHILSSCAYWYTSEKARKPNSRERILLKTCNVHRLRSLLHVGQNEVGVSTLYFVRIESNFVAETPFTKVRLSMGWLAGVGPKSESG